MKQNTWKTEIRDFRIIFCVPGIYRDYRLSQIFAHRTFNTNHCSSRFELVGSSVPCSLYLHDLNSNNKWYKYTSASFHAVN